MGGLLSSRTILEIILVQDTILNRFTDYCRSIMWSGGDGAREFCLLRDLVINRLKSLTWPVYIT